MNITLEQLLDHARNNPDKTFNMNFNNCLAGDYCRSALGGVEVSAWFEEVIYYKNDERIVARLPKVFAEWCSDFCQDFGLCPCTGAEIVPILERMIGSAQEAK